MNGMDLFAVLLARGKGGGGISPESIDTQVNGDSENPVQNKAIYNFVNSSVATNTAYYISDNGEPFTSVQALEAYSGEVSNNDYAFVTGTDSSGNTYYDRYKATDSNGVITWAKEYRLNNSSFTATQWATIQSGFTAADKTQLNTNTSVISTLTNTVNDIPNVYQRKDDTVVLTQSEYDDLITKTARFYAIIEDED